MIDAELLLRVPRADERDEVLHACQATTDVPWFAGYRPDMDFGRYLQRLSDHQHGRHLKAGRVASTFLFAFAGARIVGRVSIRHELNESLAYRGGHIGFVVVPEFRRRGYATAMLRRALRIARDQLGLPRVLLTCDDDNVASIKVIEYNGGVLEAVVTGDPQVRPFRRYWIDTPE